MTVVISIGLPDARALVGRTTLTCHLRLTLAFLSATLPPHRMLKGTSCRNIPIVVRFILIMQPGDSNFSPLDGS